MRATRSLGSLCSARLRRFVAVTASVCLIGAAGLVIGTAAPAGAVSCDQTVDASLVHSAIATIQAGIDAASNGQTICVWPGLYNTDNATSRDPNTGGSGSNDFNIFVGKSVTIEGLNGSGALITSAPEGASSSVAPVIEAANSLPDFGSSNIFVQADNVTLRGLEINGTPNDIAKSVEIVGNGDTVNDVAFAPSSVSGGVGIYISDYHFDPTGSGTSTVTNYTFTNNTFDGTHNFESGIYVASGAGWTGPASGRVITGNSFSGLDDAMDFAGPGAAGWLLYPVGTATITGNTFSSIDRRDLLVWGDGGPGVGYVSPDWCGIMAGNTIDAGSFIWHGATQCPGGTARTWDSGDFHEIAGLYSQIQRYGINKSQDGDTLQVLPGTYPENLTVPDALRITGAGPTTIVEPAVSDPNCGGGGGGTLCTGGSNVFLVQHSDVTIDHLTVDGDNPTLTSGESLGGADVDARNGIVEDFNAGVLNNTSVHNVTVKNIFWRGIYASSGGTGFNFTNNTVDNVQGDPNGSVAMFNYGGSGTMAGNHVSNAFDAISANHSTGTQFTGNTVTASAGGVHTDNEGDSGGSADVISGNTVSACTSGGFGIFAFVPYLAPTISNNTVSGCDVGVGVFASCDLGGTNYCPGGVIPTVAVSNNNVTDVVNGDGIDISTTALGFGDGEVHASADHNTISGPGKGVHVEETGTSHATATVIRNSLPSLFNSGATNVDARCNWWGSASGPAAGQYFGPATVAPFLTTSNLSGACLPIAGLGLSAVKTAEGSSGTHLVTLTVTLNGPSTSTAVVHWATQHLTAGPGDYIGASGNLTFAPGDTSKSLTVSIRGDKTLEPNETFRVNLTPVSGVAIGNAHETVVILNDEKPTLKLTVSSATLNEGAKGTFNITLAQQYTHPVTVTVKTVNGSATGGADFGAFSVTKTFQPGVTTVVISSLPVINVFKDGVIEGAETFSLQATSPQINNSPQTVQITIPGNST